MYKSNMAKAFYFGYVNKLGMFTVNLHQSYSEQLTELLNLSFLQRFNYPSKMIKLVTGEKEAISTLLI